MKLFTELETAIEEMESSGGAVLRTTIDWVIAGGSANDPQAMINPVPAWEVVDGDQIFDRLLARHEGDKVAAEKNMQELEREGWIEQ